MTAGFVFPDVGAWISGPCLDPGQLSAPDPVRDLMTRFGGRWDIEVRPGGLDVLAAVRRSPDGSSIRVIVGRTAEELAAKLHTAEVPEP